MPRPGDTPEDPVWYPFTQMQEYRDAPPVSIIQGEGRFLIDTEGNRYLDGVSSLWCNVHGHRHPAIDAAVRDQLGRIAHSTMLGLTHPWGQELARRLVRLAPEGLTRVFYSDSGATATEIALKMAYQYWQLVGRPEKTRFLRLENAYHGDTVGAVSIGGIDLFHDRFRDLIFETVPVPSPTLYRHRWEDDPDEAELGRRYLAEAEALIETHAGTAAAFVIEPLLQGAAGMIRAPEGYLRGIRELTREHDLLLIADEVAVGFGRTGRMFACEWEAVSPDLLCLAKGISAGYLPLAATLATETVFEAFLGQYAEAKTFYHGHTYTGNPLGCAAALASLDVFGEERTLAEDVFGPKAARYAAGMDRLATLPHVGDVRFRGLMGGVELVLDPAAKTPYPFAERMAHRVVLEARTRGVIVRPLGDVLILLPPLSVTLDELDLLFHVVEESIRAATED